MTNAPKRKRRWFQYRLRTLLVLVTLLGIVAKWLGVPIVEARRQAKAVQAITACGGIVLREGSSVFPAWLVQFLGPELGERVNRVRFWYGWTDAGLESLKDLPDLESLEIDGGELNEVELERLGELSGLTDLTLIRVRVAGVVSLNADRLTHLEIFLRGDEAAGATLQFLGKLTSLQSLQLGGSGITGAALPRLGTLPSLRVLNLNYTDITDAGVASLTKLTTLEELYLCHTMITDAGLQQLRQLNQLERLGVAGSGATKQGIWQLKAALPKCDIVD